MYAAWYERNGPAAQVLQFGHCATPEPEAGEVRVRLQFSGVNPSDVKSRAGGRAVSGDFVIPHNDGAGVIDKVGSGVSPTRLGERVWLWNAQYKRRFGTAAQYITLPACQAVCLPSTVSFQAGACLGVPALTAYRAVELACLEPGQSVLIIGGASSVGFYAAQMALSHGARVIATVGSNEKASPLQRQGIVDTILYKEESVHERVLSLTNGEGVRAIIDMDFSTSSMLVDQGVLAPHGHFVCFGSNQRAHVPVNYAAWLPRSLTLSFFLVYELTQEQRMRAISGVQSLLAKGSLEHPIGQCFALEDIVAAHQAVERPSVSGHVLVDCS